MTLEERRRTVAKLIRQIQQERVGPARRCLLRIVEIGGSDVAGWFSMGHFARAVVEDRADAIVAARRWPYLEVMQGMDPNDRPFDITIRGDQIEQGPPLTVA